MLQWSTMLRRPGELTPAPVAGEAFRAGRGPEVGRCARGAGRRDGVGVRRLDLDVLREGDDALDEGPVLLEAPGGVRGEFADLARVEVGHLDDGGAVGPPRLDIEARDDRWVRGRPHRTVDRVGAIRDDRVRRAAEQNLVAAPLPDEDAVADGHPSEVAVGVLRDRRDQEHLLAERLLGDLEEELVIDPMGDEEPGVGDGARGDHLRVRLDLLLRRVRRLRRRGGANGLRLSNERQARASAHDHGNERDRARSQHRHLLDHPGFLCSARGRWTPAGLRIENE